MPPPVRALVIRPAAAAGASARFVGHHDRRDGDEPNHVADEERVQNARRADTGEDDGDQADDDERCDADANHDPPLAAWGWIQRPEYGERCDPEHNAKPAGQREG